MWKVLLPIQLGFGRISKWKKWTNSVRVLQSIGDSGWNQKRSRIKRDSLRNQPLNHKPWRISLKLLKMNKSLEVHCCSNMISTRKVLDRYVYPPAFLHCFNQIELPYPLRQEVYLLDLFSNNILLFSASYIEKQ